MDRRCDRRFGRKLNDFWLIGGFTHQTTQILPANGASFLHCLSLALNH